MLTSCEESQNKKNKIEISQNDFRNWVRKDEFKKVKLALENGYDVNDLNVGGGNALHDSSSFKMTKLLIDNGANVNQQKHLMYDGWTPLHLHCIGGTDVEIVELLLDAGADPEIIDSQGKKPLDYAMERSKSKEDWAIEYKKKADLIKGQMGNFSK